VFQYTLTQEQYNYSTIDDDDDDDDCDYDCDVSHGLLTTCFKGLKANFRTTVYPISIQILAGKPSDFYYATRRKTANEKNR